MCIQPALETAFREIRLPPIRLLAAEKILSNPTGCPLLFWVVGMPPTACRRKSIYSIVRAEMRGNMEFTQGRNDPGTRDEKNAFH